MFVYIRQLVLLSLFIGQMFYNLVAIGRSDIKCQNIKEAFIVSYLISTRTNSHWCISQILVFYWLVNLSKPLCLCTCACLASQRQTSSNQGYKCTLLYFNPWSNVTIMDILIRIIPVEKQEIYRCMSLITVNLEEECWQCYSSMLKKLREQAADLTGHLQMGRLEYTLTVRNFVTKKAYKIPNQDTFKTILTKLRTQENITGSYDILCKFIQQQECTLTPTLSYNL